MSVLESILGFLGLLGPAGATPGTQVLNVWVDLPITSETNTTPYTITSTSQDMTALRALFAPTSGGTTFDFATGLITKGLIRASPADATKFQVQLGLRVVYPSRPKNPNAVGGSKPVPLVLLNHGQHANWAVSGGWVASATPNVVVPGDIAITNNLDGYAYLQDALASQGLISVSIDHNFACRLGSLIETRADTIIAALNALAVEAASSTSRFHNRLDFGNIGLMGHSRGGDGVVRAMTKIRADAALSAKYTIKTVCSLAPTDFSGSNAPANRIFIDQNDLALYTVVYGALDGDVSGWGGANGFPGTGFRHFDRARCQKSMVFLDACCHDFFNTVWTAGSTEAGHADPRLASASTHQDILVDYLTDQFRGWLGPKTAPQRFDGRSSNRAGMHASLQWMFGQQLKRIDDFENPAANLLGGARAVLNIGQPAAIEDITAIAVPTGTLADHTGHQTHVLHVDLTLGTPATSRVLTDAIPATDQDWSAFDTLIVGLAGWFDPTSDATIAAANLPRLRVTLIDSANVQASVDWTQYGATLPSRPVFKNIAGLGNQTLMRLETIPIPLTAFAGPDKTKIATLALDILPDNDTHVMVDNIHAVQR
jgi:hypothetical protein